ncbi:YciI family protein [Kocuria salsicia]|uniref:YciI family protein n=1 Tax=Kocuria salsicia TaxID=664639 RepID=UPI0031D59A69
MAQFMISVFHQADAQSSGAVYATQEEMNEAVAAVTRFNEDLQAAGQLLFSGSLTPPSLAHTVDAVGAAATTPRVSPGPFSISATALGGFWIIEAPNDTVALDRAAQRSAACGQRVELRALEG